MHLTRNWKSVECMILIGFVRESIPCIDLIAVSALHSTGNFNEPCYTSNVFTITLSIRIPKTYCKTYFTI